MSEPIALTIPLINPNEREAVLIALNIQESQPVKRGQLIATIESTKSTLDIFSEQSGLVKGLAWKIGDPVTAGDLLCYLVENLADALPVSTKPTPKIEAALPANLRITQPALNLAQKANLDLAQFQTDGLITEAMVKAVINRTATPISLAANDRSLVLFGGGGHGKSLIELIRAGSDYEVVGIVDDGLPVGESVLGVPILGGAERLSAIRQQGVMHAVNAVGGIGNINSRLRVFELLSEAGFNQPPVIHPRALCEPSSNIQSGVQIFALAYIGSSSRVGMGCIINTGAIISHDCIIGDYSNISPGAILAGRVEIEEQVLVGMGVTINISVRVGGGARIGNGATIKADVPPGGVVKAGAVWPA